MFEDGDVYGLTMRKLTVESLLEVLLFKDLASLMAGRTRFIQNPLRFAGSSMRKLVAPTLPNLLLTAMSPNLPTITPYRDVAQPTYADVNHLRHRRYPLASGY